MKKLTSKLYFWVLVSIVAGFATGALFPDTGASLKPLGDAFIKMVKIVVAPIIFCTVALGLGQTANIKKLGRVGGKTILYFEVVSTLALILGLVAAYTMKPGVGLNIDPNTLDASKVEGFVTAAAHGGSTADFFMHIIPPSFVGAFANGDLLQVLFMAILFGIALMGIGSKAKPVIDMLESVSKVFFQIMNIIMKFSPIGAFGAMAFTVGAYGLDSMATLAEFVGVFFLACGVFIFGVLGLIAKISGFSLIQYFSFIKEEIILVLATSSSESALPRLMQKLELIGCKKDTVGLVIPTGYSFNLDGTNIYMTLATIFLAQAMNIELTFAQEMTLLGVAMLSSKGASGVSGAGFITLAATLAVVPAIPVASMALILGIDRFMSTGRAVTNFIGNGIACLVISLWEKELDKKKLAFRLSDKNLLIEELDAIDNPVGKAA